MAFTFFFRDLDAIGLIPKYVAPELSQQETIRIWDAGCANGPEIYSLLIHLKENLSDEIFKKITVFGTDIDRSGLFEDTITKGIYRKTQMSSVPPAILEKYFTKETENPESYSVSEELRDKIIYKKHDLLSLNAIGKDFDLIICKHVLQHFSPEEQKDVIKMFYHSLTETGFLLTEFSQEIPECFNTYFMRVLAEQNLYRKIK